MTRNEKEADEKWTKKKKQKYTKIQLMQEKVIF